jgi:MinD-like ATPase involved in chromosome partitioning or flagellar assembly
MSANVSPNLDMDFAGATEAEPFLIALIGPDAEKRNTVAEALTKWPGADVRQFPSYPPSFDDVTGLLNLNFDVIVIDADSDAEYAIKIVENIASRNSATIMTYSWTVKQELADRFRNAGAREYLEAPFEFSVPSALERAADARNARNNPAKSWEAKQLVFFGAKGGSGATTLACSLATALAQETRQRTLLIDLGLPLGDAALNLGLTSEYSTEDALKDPERMDPSLLEAIVARHESGLDVLAAPGKVPEIAPSSEAIDKLMKTARKVFTNVIVDVGSRVDLMETSLFGEAYRIYLVSQAGISDLRNAERLISRYFQNERQRLEIVINRFEPNSSQVPEDQMTSALGRQVRWKVPASANPIQLSQSSNLPMANPDSPYSQAVLEMAGSITLHPVRTNKNNAANSEYDVLSEGQGGADGKKEVKIGTPANGGLPEITWHTPEPITFGTPLNGSHLNATASVPGAFSYTPAAGYVLPVGTHTLWVTFNSEDGKMVQSAVSVTVSKATPTINWPVPRPIACDMPLSDMQLNATASVAGDFEYSPEIGTILPAGEHALTAVFTPADDKSYAATKATVSMTVEKLKPVIDWPVPEKMLCGAKLGPAQLNAKASVDGTIVYSPGAGEILEPGQHVLTAHFTPSDGARYSASQSSITVTVMKAPPRITWGTPASITYGTPLGPIQLNATASEEGSFEYFPSAGAMLTVGEHTPLVTFKAYDNADYPSVQSAVRLSVVMAKPTISWNGPATISAGTPLSSTELNATASVPGSFHYKPGIGEVLPVGKHTLSVTFTPTDSMNYELVRDSISITVTELEKVKIDWPAPAAIPYGTPLSGNQLNASASVPGRFAYGPCEGNVLPPGDHTLLAMFTPDDQRNYSISTANVVLKVEAPAEVDSLLTVHTKAPTERELEVRPIADANEWKSATPRNIAPLKREVEEQSIAEINEWKAVSRKVNPPVQRELEEQSIAEINEWESATRRMSTAVQREVEVAEPAPVEERDLILERITGKPAHVSKASTPPPPPRAPRETRAYKGVIYEKGDDGQWHRVQR